MVLPSSIHGNATFLKARRVSQAATRYVTCRTHWHLARGGAEECYGRWVSRRSPVK